MACGAYALYIVAYLFFLLGMGLLSQQWFLDVHKDIFAAAAKAKQSCLFRPTGSLLWALAVPGQQIMLLDWTVSLCLGRRVTGHLAQALLSSHQAVAHAYLPSWHHRHVPSPGSGVRFLPINALPCR